MLPLSKAKNLPEYILSCQVDHSMRFIGEALLLHLVPGHKKLHLHPGDDDHLIARPLCQETPELPPTRTFSGLLVLSLVSVRGAPPQGSSADTITIPASLEKTPCFLLEKSGNMEDDQGVCKTDHTEENILLKLFFLMTTSNFHITFLQIMT